MRRQKSLFIVIAVLMLSSNLVMAQNYWGEGHNQSLSGNPNPIINQKPPGKITELPDVPDVGSQDTSFNNKIEEGENVKVSSSKSPVLELSASSEKIPVGSRLNIVLNNDLNAKKSKLGDPFSATIKEDVVVNSNIVLPAGTLIRGRIGKVKKPGVFSKSGSIILNFDHIVTPLGRHITLDADFSSNNKVNKKGALVANDGFIGAIKDSAKSGVHTTKVVTKAGYDAGMAAGVVPVVATAPAGAAVGVLAGTTVFATKSTIAIFKKGGNPKINAGEQIEIEFSEEMDIPVN